jgi:hypothetical protein
MSYTRNYQASVPYSGSISGTFSYPASQSGGSRSVTLNYSGSEPVSIGIIVETASFDESINSCENHIDVLTGSVVATKTAHVMEIGKRATEISKTVINGFFKTVNAEISQQISALENEANSSLLHLQKVKEKIIALKDQMQGDYGRISDRYLKVFEELNAELINRIWQIDNKVFEFEQIIKKNMNRLLGTDLSTTVSVFGRENATLSAKISTSSAKERALVAINKAKDFLCTRKHMDYIIQEAAINEAKEKIFYVPGCFMETGDNSYNVLITKDSKALDDSNIIKDVAGKFKDDNLNWQNISEKEYEQISVHLNACINENYGSADPREKRIREMTQKLVNLQGVQICRN